MNLFVKIAFSASLALSLTACISYRAPAYQGSADTLLQLQQLNIQPIALAGVSRSAGIKDSTHCRSQGKVKASAGDYASYVDSALRTELANAGLLASQATTQLTATLQRMEFNSWNNSWNMTLELISSNGNSLTTTSEYQGNNASLEDDAACHLAAQAMPAAVQKLLHDALTNSEFASLLTPIAKTG